MTSKPGNQCGPGMSLAGACLLARRCPAWRWRERGLGSRAERVNLRPDGAASQWSGVVLRLACWSENLKRLKP